MAYIEWVGIVFLTFFLVFCSGFVMFHKLFREQLQCLCTHRSSHWIAGLPCLNAQFQHFSKLCI